MTAIEMRMLWLVGFLVVALLVVLAAVAVQRMHARFGGRVAIPVRVTPQIGRPVHDTARRVPGR